MTKSKEPKKRSLYDIAKDKFTNKPKKKPSKKKPAKKTTSKDVPGSGLASKAAKAIEVRKKKLKDI